MKKIKHPRKIKSIATITLVLLLMISAFSMITTSLYAQGLHTADEDNGAIPYIPAGVTPDYTVKTDIYLSFRPNPVGVGQYILVNVWNDPGPSYARYFTDYKITIEDPEGIQDVKLIDSYAADGTAWFEYQVNKIGTWKLKFDFPGGYFPAGIYAAEARPGYYEEYPNSVWYLPDSTDWQELTVQEDMVYSWPPRDLPTDYWTRPVSPENREWATILGDYPWRGPGGGPDWPADTNTHWSGRYLFNPYVQGPESAHIVWRRQDSIAGIMGGDWGIMSQTGRGNTPEIIYQGRCYNSISKPFNGEYQSVWTCTDLRTGEVIWERTGVSAPRYIEYSLGGAAVPGAEPGRVSVSLLSISASSLTKYDPITGRETFSMDLPRMVEVIDSFGGGGAHTYYMNGYCLAVQVLTSTKEFRLINWTTFGSSRNFDSRIVSNISFPLDTIGQFQDHEASICFVIREPNAWMGTHPWTGFPYVNISATDASTGMRHGMRIMAADLKTGQLLYNMTFDDEPFSAAQSPYSQNTHVADHGKLACLTRKGYFNVYNERTGQFLFKTETMDYPWDEPGFGAYSIQSAYGLFYRQGYGGVYAFNWTDGKIVWKYKAPALSQYETPYTDENGVTVYSFNAGGIIADGKMYTYNTEHSPTQPITRGWGIHCIDALTGEGIWNLSTQCSPGAIADGYLTTADGFTGYMNVFGKGESALTVTAPDVEVPLGTGIMIRGTILDMSPAQPGTPCVSKNSMATQMEYLHYGQPIDGLWGNEIITGVPVVLTAINQETMDVTDLGMVTSNGYYGTFGFEWTPSEQGTYEIIASFNSDESYGSSASSTFISVGPAPQETQTPEPSPSPEPEHPIISTEAVLVIGVVVVAVVAILAYWAMKRRQ